MKKLLLILFVSPIICYSQFSIGDDQTICANDSAHIVSVASGGASGCTGVSDSLITPVAGGNGSAGTTFNVVNTSGSPLDITGISQGGTYVMTNDLIEVWMYAGNIYSAPLPVGAPPYTGWVLVGSANVSTLGTPTSFGYVPISGVTIPATETYTFRVQRMTSGSVSYTNGTGNPGSSVWASDANISITEGHGGSLTNWFSFSPRCFNGIVHYGGGANWIDLSTGLSIGSGDSLTYSPSQTTDICAILNCNGSTYSDTMTINVLDRDISTTGFSLCNGNVLLTAPNNFSSYNWNNSSNSSILTVNSAGDYYVSCTTSNGLTCQSDTITIYSGNISVSLSTPDSVFICQGDTVTINAPNGFTSYNWSTGATTSTITTTLTGNYSLNVVDGNGCPGTSNTTSVSISPQTVVATTTGSSLCNGAVILEAQAGFSTYQWYNNGNLMNNTSQSLVVNAPGLYHYEVVYPTGCSATSNSLAIVAGTASFNVTISSVGSDSLCRPNGQVILDAGNYSSFLWSNGDTTQQITVSSMGSYSVDVLDLNGCQGSSNVDFEVFDAVNTSEISGPTNPTQFQTVNYSVLSTPGSTYNWDFLGGTIQSGLGSNTIDVVWNNSGGFTLSVIETNSDGCVGEEETIVVYVILSSIEDFNNSNNEAIKITDIFGRKTEKKKNTPLFYHYGNGVVKKSIIVE